MFVVDKSPKENSIEGVPISIGGELWDSFDLGNGFACLCRGACGEDVSLCTLFTARDVTFHRTQIRLPLNARLKDGAVTFDCQSDCNFGQAGGDTVVIDATVSDNFDVYFMGYQFDVTRHSLELRKAEAFPVNARFLGVSGVSDLRQPAFPVRQEDGRTYVPIKDVTSVGFDYGKARRALLL